MSKTVMRNIRLVNWYGFNNTTIPVAENLTLISGENECGKSTILDAIKYAYTGDTQFNKATSGSQGTGKRNLMSYTRCLMDASAGIYARPVEKIPTVYTHIALEYEDQVNERPFVLGVIIETATADIRSTAWYALDGKRLEDIDYVYKDKSVLKPYDISGFQKRYAVQMKGKKDGITLFMQMTGLKLPYQEVFRYQRKLRSIMAYNPAAKIQEFIRESVLETHNVNFDKLKEAKKNIEKINLSLEQINQELQDLDKILKDYDEHDRRELRLRIDDIKTVYQKLVKYRERRKEIEEQIHNSRIRCGELECLIAEENGAIDEIDAYYTEARNALREMDAAKAILASEELLESYRRQLAALEQQMEALEQFQARMLEVAGMLEREGVRLPDGNMAEKLTSVTTEAVEKQRYVDWLREAVGSTRDGMLQELGIVKQDLTDIQRECTEQARIIESCEKNRADYSHVGEQLGLIGEINREFKARGLTGEARMACEYVFGLKDEGWRDAIEAFLGVHRYAIIVPPEAFAAANAVMDRSRHRYVELVNTKRLMVREQKCEEDSVFHQLEIRNETAARYFAFWLGRIHAVETAQVPDYDNAMSKEGKMSRNMAVTYINKKRIQSYCLGNDAIELNRRSAQRKLDELEAKEKELLSKEYDLRGKAAFLGNELNAFKDYNLNAHREAAQMAEKLNEESRHHAELLEAQKNNEEFVALSQRVADLEKQLNDRKRTREAQMAEKSKLEAETGVNQKESERYGQMEREAKGKLDEESVQYKSAVETAIEEYDAWLAGSNKDGGLMQPVTKERASRRVRELEAEINGLQQAYNNRRQDTDRLPIGMEHEASYQKRRGKIWIDDLQGIQQKLKEQTARYERIFKREFVLNIYETAKSARNDITDINKELRKLRFSTKYQFDVRLLDDRSDYAKILNYAEYLQRTNDMGDGQISFSMITEYSEEETEEREEEIREIINRIIEKDDAEEMKRFADYRNYMSYEIIINNDEVKDGRLSRQVGYNSGAGTQIPYTLILSAALSMLYNARVNSVRLLFIDEPFEKMSDHNIKLMLEFFKDQDFQVIFCAPPNKLESIGSECGVIIPVLKISNDDMQIGKVKFHDQQL